MNRLNVPSFRQLIPLIKILIAFAVLAGLSISVRSAIHQWDAQTENVQQQLAELDQHMRSSSGQRLSELSARRTILAASVPRFSNLNWRGLTLSMLLYGCGLVPSAYVLRSAVSTMGSSARVSTCVASQLLGHVGKYVPGKAMVIILRAGGLARDGVRPLTATISVFMETFLMLAVGASLSGAIVFWLPVPRWMTWSAAAVAVASSIPTFPPVMRRIVARVSSSRVKQIQPREVEVSGSVRFFFVGWGWSLLSWVLIGLSFAVLVASIPSANPLPPPLTLIAISTASMGLAMVIGFASLLPGGAGIRELILTTLLATSVGPAHALLAAIAARLTSIAVESVLAVGAWIWLRQNARTND